ncbi:hypothetical protein G5B40_16310 [Pikeienuella piscinae]|uniref:Uncharacterized protein n=1 Tax=Pikeienuella piscinae TaxID=2748098 RepID=A0A7L5BZF4_9RHOB|nr:hypothetical protein [Pikeienuella piscinae]QIE56861.1 hypothetical protein G5B40_16310 [Pikeienuella piscinae]
MAFPAFLVSTCIMWMATFALWLKFPYGFFASLGIGVVIGTAAFFLIIGLHVAVRKLFCSAENDNLSLDTVASERR